MPSNTLDAFSDPIKTFPNVKLFPILINPVFTLLPIVNSFPADWIIFVFRVFIVVVPNNVVEEKKDPIVMVPVVKLFPIIIDVSGVRLSNLFVLARVVVKSDTIPLDTFKTETFA